MAFWARVVRFLILAVAVFGAGGLTAESAKPTAIRVVLDNNYPPFTFIDGEGVLQGILIDQWRLWEKKTGITVELHGMDWGQALKRMQAGEFDVIDTVFWTEQRARYFDFTKAYQKIEVPIFFDAEISGITDARSLRGFPVGVKAGDAAISLLRENGVETLLPFESYEAILKAAKDRRIAVFVVDKPPALYYLHKLGIDRIYRQSAPLNVGEFHRAVAKGNTRLRQSIEEGFAKISPEELKAIEGKWYGEKAYGEHSLRFLLPLAVGIVFLVAVLFVWNAVLRRAVRRHTAALKASEERFQSIYHSVSDALFIHDADTGRLLDVNNRMCEMFGCTVEEALHSSSNDFSLGESPYSQVEALAWLKKAAAGESPVFTWRCCRKDRSLFWSEIRMRRARVGQDEVVVVSVSDITDRKLSEHELQDSIERFRQLAENIDEVFWMIRVEDGTLLYVSPAYEKIWGTRCTDLGAQPASWAEALHPDDRARVLSAIATKQRRGEYAETYRIVRPDGQTRWIYDRAFPVRDASGQIYRMVGIAADITNQRTLEVQVRQAQKMEALGTLAGGIAHDFNNILGAITGYTELAKIDSTSATVQASHNEILLACKRAADLVRQILAFSRQQEQRRVPLHLWPVIEEATKLLRAALPTTIEFHQEHAPDVPVVLADPTQIHQVVMNLSTNAAHAMGGGPGRFTVKLERFEADAAFTQLHPGSRSGSYALLSVSDTGHGMERPVLDRIFDPFFTTKQPGEGTGLGLAVVHGIVQNHQGLITVLSRLGEGTVFKLYFPAHEGAVARETLAVEEVPLGRGQRVLVVDDEVPLVEMVGRILTKIGYTVETSTLPVEALANFCAAPQRYDLILTDLTMPQLTGLEFARRALAVRPQLPIILMTGFNANLTDEQLAAVGFKYVLLKPVTLKNLSQAIDRLLAPK